MAIIKCPECGHQISDKAPTCPSCGVEIAGKVARCPKCGEVYLSHEDWCPHCHYPTQRASADMRAVMAPVISAAAGGTTTDEAPAKKEKNDTTTDGGKAVAPPKKRQQTPPPPKKKTSRVGIIVSFVIALIICGICFYMYKDAQDKKEMQEWNFAMQSNDPLVLQGYLDTFKDAPLAHRDSIEAHLQAIKQVDTDWTNALVSLSKSALEEYIRKHPESSHKQEAKHLIDSIDWAFCLNANSIDEYLLYMKNHDDGDHYDEAEDAMKKLKAQDISPEEKDILATIFHHFFVSINSRDENGLLGNTVEGMTLLDKTNTSKADVVEFMNRWYKDDVSAITFKLPGQYDIKKREVADGQYEYEVTFPATLDIQHADAAKNATNKYRVNAVVNPEFKISLLKMTKLVE